MSLGFRDPRQRGLIEGQRRRHPAEARFLAKMDLPQTWAE